MASATKATWNKRDRNHANGGKRRKAKESVKSTLSSAELFGALGEPGKKASAKAAVQKSK
jgi:hypothetical protein